MIDPIYLALILCLLATNHTRLLAVVHWILRFLLRPQNHERLVPYYDRQGSHLICLEAPLETHPIGESSPSHDGQFRALFSWQDVLDTNELTINWIYQGAPAIRRVDLHRQPCLCGEKLLLYPCGIESSTYFFRDGAFFVNSGQHTHSKYTHSLVYRPHEPFEFTDYMSKHPIAFKEPSDSEDSE
ncbi:hypothetical protein DFH07DRAFT_944259 [Mycena maculata]|uniref:Uncharacterized protein n=1 Tax=Mycena maculata TaxID=230809 RepID=A0AAD7MXL0_9AGAR|nr:hypothetical protein DFH07DRAFT_944259 [Mycena maculata]